MTPPPVLYVEDDDSDVLLMRRAWKKVDVQNPLQVVTDGQDALRISPVKSSMRIAVITRCLASCCWT
jgi:hypothetical protein